MKIKQQKKEEFKMPKKITGLKISHYSADIMTFQNGIPEEAISVEYGSYTDAVPTIKAAIRSLNVSDMAFLCIPEDEIITLNGILAEPMRPETMLLNIPYEFKDYINTDDIPNYTFEYRVTKENMSSAGTVESWTISAMAIKTSTLDRYINIAKMAGFTIVKAVPEGQCFRDLANIANKKDSSKYVVFLTSLFNGITIHGYCEGEVVFERSLENDTLADDESKRVEIQRSIARFEYEHPDLEDFQIYVSGQAMNGHFVDQIQEYIPNHRVLNAGSLLPPGYEEDICSALIELVAIMLPGESSQNLKQTFNLVEPPKKAFDVKKLIIAIAAVVVLLIFGKFGVLDLFQERDAAVALLYDAQDDYQVIAAQTVSYDEVKREYAKYNMDYLTEGEKNMIDPLQCQEVVQKYIFPYATVSSISVNGNDIIASVSDASMTRMATILKQLDQFGGKEYATYSGISSEGVYDPTDQTLMAQSFITITLNPEYIKKYGTDIVSSDTSEEKTISGGESTEPEYAQEIEAPEGDYTLDEIAWQVIRGKWGNAPVRYDLLAERGYDSEEVQRRVDEFCQLYNIKINETAEVIDMNTSLKGQTKTKKSQDTDQKNKTSTEKKKQSTSKDKQEALDDFFGSAIGDALAGEDIAKDIDFNER